MIIKLLYKISILVLIESNKLYLNGLKIVYLGISFFFNQLLLTPNLYHEF